MDSVQQATDCLDIPDLVCITLAPEADITALNIERDGGTMTVTLTITKNVPTKLPISGR